MGNITQNPFLVDMGPNSPPVKWLCLSYCWGGVELAVKLTRANMDKLKSRMLSDSERVESFDATVRDVILVAKASGYPLYLDRCTVYFLR